MPKRIFSLLLALLLVLAPMNAAIPASAAESDNESPIRSDFRAFVATLNPGEGVNDAISEVFNHIIFGGGKDLELGASDAFTGLLLSANLYEDGLVDGLAAGFETLRSTGGSSLTATGKYTWTEHTKSYRYSANGSVLAANDNYTGSLNACDDALVTAGCSADAGFTITRNPVTNNCTVSIQISGIFDINAVDASFIDDPQIQEGLKWVKAMQKLGLGSKAFRWIVSAEFSLLFPTACTHTYGAWSNRDSATHTRTCTACGDEQSAAHTWDSGKAVESGISFTCTACAATKTATSTKVTNQQIVGTWETDLVFPAADLGVQAKDTVFRCTLTFTEDGVVTASWIPVELEAIKLSFHQLFVNAYYACAYALGYTDLEAIDAFCMESTGKSVGDYMMSFLDDYDMKAMFTPAAASGIYSYSNNQLYWDLQLMELTSTPSVGNRILLDGDIMIIPLLSHDRADYNMVCKRVN